MIRVHRCPVKTRKLPAVTSQAFDLLGSDAATVDKALTDAGYVELKESSMNSVVARALKKVRKGIKAESSEQVMYVYNLPQDQFDYLVLSKAKGAYEEIVAAADVRAEEIVSKANQEAATIRSSAESQISDLTEKLAALRKQTADYYASLKKVVDAQNASLDQIKKLL